MQLALTRRGNHAASQLAATRPREIKEILFRRQLRDADWRQAQRRTASAQNGNGGGDDGGPTGFGRSWTLHG